jgi:hypothetical protein
MRVLKMEDDALSSPRAQRFSFAGGNDGAFPSTRKSLFEHLR